MKLETQRDRWRAVLDGREVVDIDGRRVKFIDGYLHTFYNEAWIKTYIDFLEDIAGWQLYEPPKPENKVIVIGAGPSLYFVDALNPEIGYVSENDAIRAAMTWIGEKARHLIIKRPDWCPVEREEYLFVAGWTHGQRESLREALLMRWPIEVLEEV